MHRQIFKGKSFPKRGAAKQRGSPISEGTHRSEIYNMTNGECRWPYDVFGNVGTCSFKPSMVYDSGKGYSIYVLEKGTEIYHSTVAIGGAKWWENRYPFSSSEGGTWFTSTDKHAKNFTTKSHVLKYTIVRDIYLIFIQNISKYTDVVGLSGFEFVARHYAILKEKAKLEWGATVPEIDGYLGCNECEIFIENDEIEKHLGDQPEIIFQRDSSYID